MQITLDKCPGGDESEGCRDPYYNINAGASYLRHTLDEVGNNLALAIGKYNGWKQGMTYYDATKAGEAKNTCFAQNNLDYLHQTLNGWMQGINPYDRDMGVFFNLKYC